MKLISTHVCMTKDIGVHGNLFGGVMLGWLDEAGAAFSSEMCGTPRMVTVKISEVIFQKPVRPGQIIKIYGSLEGFGNTSCVLRIEARRHSTYNGSEKVVCQTKMRFVRIDGDGEPVPIPDHMRQLWAEDKG